ncbi:hypothetical protein EVG20_g7337 [Dentipellis fragilis]|uniref:Uncharacterized protein n=1 Tax=Dentipellis fragilis TaxID=205917 RepID=A0A4Y9YDS2_9AGAM|nr:hypothetical protein EVG20_g7337 [Dentipellis fragilis]
MAVEIAAACGHSGSYFLLHISYLILRPALALAVHEDREDRRHFVYMWRCGGKLRCIDRKSILDRQVSLLVSLRLHAGASCSVLRAPCFVQVSPGRRRPSLGHFSFSLLMITDLGGVRCRRASEQELAPSSAESSILSADGWQRPETRCGGLRTRARNSGLGSRKSGLGRRDVRSY